MKTPPVQDLWAGGVVLPVGKIAAARRLVGGRSSLGRFVKKITRACLEGNPTLMRVRELEVLEKIAAGGKLNVVLGEKGLAERVVNLL